MINEHPMPDFSQPGADGALPDAFIPWRWGVTYTVRPELLSTLVPGQEYRIAVSVVRKLQNSENLNGYADLYEHATAIAEARASQLTCPAEGNVLHKRILAHGWFRHGDTNLVRAFLL